MYPKRYLGIGLLHIKLFDPWIIAALHALHAPRAVQLCKDRLHSYPTLSSRPLQNPARSRPTRPSSRRPLLRSRARCSSRQVRREVGLRAPERGCEGGGRPLALPFRRARAVADSKLTTIPTATGKRKAVQPALADDDEAFKDLAVQAKSYLSQVAPRDSVKPSHCCLHARAALAYASAGAMPRMVSAWSTHSRRWVRKPSTCKPT